MTRTETVRTKRSQTQNKKIHAFQKTVWDFYREHGRHTLPWRKTTRPYRILVSEIMLQQTQVDRVLPKYRAFLRAFPTARALAEAPLTDVLMYWQGLGYNRRAKHLHEAAKKVIKEYKGRFPKDETGLRSLPGVGPYTASAVLAFAYNIGTPLIETNVRTVYLHHFFPQREAVHDSEIMELVEETLPKEGVREWYAALMDYGTYLKKTTGNQNVRSRHYSKQSRFKGSDREIRGAVVREALALSGKGKPSVQIIERRLTQFNRARVRRQYDSLKREGLIS